MQLAFEKTQFALQDEDSKESDSSSGSEDIDNLSAAPVCDVLRVSSDHHPLSVQQRKQLRDALKGQLEDLKVQEAAKQMNILGV